MDTATIVELMRGTDHADSGAREWASGDLDGHSSLFLEGLVF
jgi:hypothetical protein